MTPVIRGTGIRVQTMIMDMKLGLTAEQSAVDYELKETQVHEAQAFYQAHQVEIDGQNLAEQNLENKRG